MKALFTLIFLISGSVFATEVAHEKIWLGQDNAYHCYMSDAYGNTPDGAPSIENDCCNWANYSDVLHHAIWLGQDQQNHCYASDQYGNTPDGTPSSPDACCVW